MEYSKRDQATFTQSKEKGKTTQENDITDVFAELELTMYTALETYSNVHRGSGHYSMVTTHLFELARDIVLEYLGLNKGQYVVIFCSPLRAEALVKQFEPGSYQVVSSREIGLQLGTRALAVKRKALPRGAPFQAGGGTARLMSREWVVWAGAPDRFEAGTPAIINIIALARALQMIKRSGNDLFLHKAGEPSGMDLCPDPAAVKKAVTRILYHDDLEKYTGREPLDELRRTLIGRDVLVPTMEGRRSFINLDNSASTPTFTPVWNTFQLAWRQPAEVQQEIIHNVKSICAEVLGAPQSAYEVIFTSNTTEAINLAAGSLGRESGEDTAPVVLNTLPEHSSNDLPWRIAPGCSLVRLPVDAEGFMDMMELETILAAYNQEGKHGKKRIRIVAVSGASNVLGVCNKMAEISGIVHRYGARLLVDAAQLVAHRTVNVEGCGIDYLAFSAHKVYAPFGCGVWVVRKELLAFNAAELELIRSSGEENVGGIAALGKALVLLQRISMDVIREEEQALTAKALRGMSQIDGLTIYGIKDPASPRFEHKIGVIVFGLKGMMSNRLADALALRGGIGVRYGCHCAHMIIKRLLNISPFLEKFQRLIVTLFPKVRLPGLTRVSLGIENSEKDVDTLIRVLGNIAGHPRTPAEGRSTKVPGETSGVPKAELQRLIKKFIKEVDEKIYLPG